MSRPTPVPASSERPPDRELSHGTSGEPRTRATDLRPSRAEPARNPWFLAVPFTIDASLTSLVGDLVVTVLLALPFYLSGIVVAVALTKVPGRIGLVYAVDLAGASLGCLLVIPLLGATNVSSATFAAAGFAALGAFCFARASEARDVRRILASAVALFTLAALNAVTHHGFRPIFVMGRLEPTAIVRFESWNTFSQVVARKPLTGPPRYWGAAPSAPDTPLVHVPMIIDGNAAPR